MLWLRHNGARCLLWLMLVLPVGAAASEGASRRGARSAGDCVHNGSDIGAGRAGGGAVTGEGAPARGEEVGLRKFVSAAARRARAR